MLSIRSLGKRYPGGTVGLVDFSLEVGEGVLGLLGGNGAGKTTLMSMLATVTKPTSGTFLWEGKDVVARPARPAPPARLPAAGFRRLREAYRPRVPPVPRPPQGTLGRGPGSPREGAPRADQPARRRRPAARRIFGRHAPARRHRAGPARRSEARHRGRADGGPGSGGARALPQPALRDRAWARRHPLDAHRLGRRSRRLAHRRHPGGATRAACDPGGAPAEGGRPRLHRRRPLRAPGRGAEDGPCLQPHPPRRRRARAVRRQRRDPSGRHGDRAGPRGRVPAFERRDGRGAAAA